MYNRIYSGGNVRVPPDYGGNAIKYHPAEQQPPRQTFSPPLQLLIITHLMKAEKNILNFHNLVIMQRKEL